MSERVKCWKCRGTGQYMSFGVCYACGGTGKARMPKAMKSAPCTCDDPRAVVMCFAHPGGK